MFDPRENAIQATMSKFTHEELVRMYHQGIDFEQELRAENAELKKKMVFVEKELTDANEQIISTVEENIELKKKIE